MNKETNVQAAYLLKTGASLIEDLTSTLINYTNLRLRSTNTGKDCLADLEAAEWMRGCLADLSATIEAMQHHAVPQEKTTTAFRLSRAELKLEPATLITHVMLTSA